MTPDEAIQRLIFHTTPEDGAFLGMLRPFKGVRPEILADAEAALRAVAARLGQDSLPRELVSALWTLVHLGRAWALEPEGMLRRNGLITDADIETLATFLDRFSYAVMCLLEQNPEEAFADYLWKE
jgi:hypothetical protein